MNKKIPLGAAISLIAIAVAVTFILTTTFSLNLFNEKVPDVKERTEINQKIEEIDTYVRSNYNGQIDETKLQDFICAGYIRGLGDKYASYHSAEDSKDISLSDSGYAVGVGITISQDESGYIRVVKVDEGTSAFEMGIKADDFIVAVNGADVLTTGYENSVKAVSGDEGTTVKVTVRRDGVDNEYQLVRKKMDIVSVTSEMLENNVGYIKITTFNSTTPKQFKIALEKLINANAKQMIFDVRNNGGGFVNSAADMLNQLLPAGEIATATYKNGDTKIIVKTDGTSTYKLPTVVLVNNKTASAAELFAAAMRDFANAQIVGVNTYGKGVMQDVVTLADGSTISVTTAKYQTTKTECYDGIGLKPNFEVALSKTEEMDFANLTSLTDPQLKKAIEVAKTMK
ncbi:MAG: S41 family peptidase [Oscillospiraceae bacterium]